MADTSFMQGGFSQPALDAQASFRAIMQAMSEPGSVYSVPMIKNAPSMLPQFINSVILTLLDNDTTVWIDPMLSSPLEALGDSGLPANRENREVAPKWSMGGEAAGLRRRVDDEISASPNSPPPQPSPVKGEGEIVRNWLGFHTGAPVVDAPARASFALISDPASMPRLSEFAQGSDTYPDRSTTLIIGCSSFTDHFVIEGPGIDGHRRFGFDPLPKDFVAQWQANRAEFPRGVDLILCGPEGVAALPRSTRILDVEAV